MMTVLTSVISAIVGFITEVPLVLSALVAFIPVYVWIRFAFHKKNEGEDGTLKTKLRFVLGAFFLGMCTIPILLLFYYLLGKYTALDYYSALHAYLVKPQIDALALVDAQSDAYQMIYAKYERVKDIYDTLTIVIDALLEEAIKLSLLIFFVVRFRLIATIGDAIIYSVLAGLGFAYLENLIFFNGIYTDPEKSMEVFINVVCFRTIVLTVGHMVFSGIFGYFLDYQNSLYQFSKSESGKAKSFHF